MPRRAGTLKAKLAKLRTQLQEPAKSGGGGEGFEVQKYGDGRVALIGFPSGALPRLSAAPPRPCRRRAS